MAKGDWQRALVAAGEITEAWLTDEDADLSTYIDAAIEKDAHDILYAMARLASAAIELHAEATGEDVRAVLRAASARALGEQPEAAIFRLRSDAQGVQIEQAC